MWPLSSSCTIDPQPVRPRRRVDSVEVGHRHPHRHQHCRVLGDVVDLLQRGAVDHGFGVGVGVAEERLQVVDVVALAHHVAQRPAGAVDEPVHAVVDGVLVVAEHVDHGLRRGVDETLVAGRGGVLVPLLHRHQCDRPGQREPPRRTRWPARRPRPARGAAADAGGGPAGRASRTLTVFGASTATPVDVVAAPLAGPAALDARRLADAASAFDRASKPCLLSSTPALEPTSDQPNSLRAPVCQYRRAYTPVPPAGSTNLPFWSYVAIDGSAGLRRRLGGQRRRLRRRRRGRLVRQRQRLGRAAAAAFCRTAARPDRAARRTATAAAAGRARSAAPATGTARAAQARARAGRRAAAAPPAAPDPDPPAVG